MRLGCTAFGGPAAHVALMHEEVVRRRAWVSEQEFLDLVGVANLIPGPNSTELAIHLGYRRAGWPGLVVAGTLFIVPAMLLVLAIAWAYVRFGTTPEADALLYGIKPVIIAIVAQALWRLGRAAVKTPLLAAVGVGVLVLYLLGGNEIALLFGGGAAAVLLTGAWQHVRTGSMSAGLVFGPSFIGWLTFPAAASAAVAFSQATLFLTFFKIGAVLYGSGYVLLAFLRNDFVERLGWLTSQQLLDAVAVGQFTPGPVFTTATFVGYLVGGVPGALVATAGIFLPAFIFVAVTAPLVARLRAVPWTASLLDGVNIAAVGLMAAVFAVLARDAVVDWFSALLAVLAALALWRTMWNSAWFVLAGGALGLGYRFVAGG